MFNPVYFPAWYPILICFEVRADPLKVVSLLQEGSLDLKLVMWPIEANGPSGRIPPSSYIKLPSTGAPLKPVNLNYITLDGNIRNKAV